MTKLVSIGESNKPDKKMMAVFDNDGRKKTVHFGSKNMDDFTISHDKDQRDRYLKRHHAREDWTDPTTAGALSRWILWGNSISKFKNITEYKKKFNL